MHVDAVQDYSCQTTDRLTCKMRVCQGFYSCVELDHMCLIVDENDETQHEPDDFRQFDVLADKVTG